MRRVEIIERTRTWGKENDMKLNSTGGRAGLRKGERQQRRKRMG